MTAPVSPYTDSATVAALSPVDLKTAGDFSASTVPPKATVDIFIGLVSGQVDMRLGMAGYVLPLETLAGETWPSHQTSYLKLITTFGAAALVFGFSRKPAPSVSPSRGNTTGNVFQDLFLAELGNIFDLQTSRSVSRLRAGYIVGTPANNQLTAPIGPMTDFMEGRVDPIRELSMDEVIMLMDKVQAHIRHYIDPPWDYMYSLFGLNKGIGPIYNE